MQPHMKPIEREGGELKISIVMIHGTAQNYNTYANDFTHIYVYANYMNHWSYAFMFFFSFIWIC
jgi:hypothetical protein